MTIRRDVRIDHDEMPKETEESEKQEVKQKEKEEKAGSG